MRNAAFQQTEQFFFINVVKQYFPRRILMGSLRCARQEVRDQVEHCLELFRLEPKYCRYIEKYNKSF